MIPLNLNTMAAQRQLYAITRSEATWLVKTYQAALKKAAEIEPFRVFRDALETQKPAYLGKFNNSYNVAVQGTFYAMALHLYHVVERLFARAADLNHDAKVNSLCVHLPTSKAIASTTISYLNWAVYNWYFRNETIIEDLNDNCYETANCAVCHFSGLQVFYFSTAYGLEQPICENCLCDNVLEPEDEEYVVEEEDDESEDDDESENDDDDDEDDDENDPDYKVEDDEEETDDDSDLSSNETEETDLDESEAEASEAEASEAGTASEDDEAKTFGCDGCSFEFRAGFKYGWRKAMKHIRNYTTNQPEPPRCETCDISHENLKKCSGQCGGIVRYCSLQCQKEDWVQHKQVCQAE